MDNAQTVNARARKGDWLRGAIRCGKGINVVATGSCPLFPRPQPGTSAANAWKRGQAPPLTRGVSWLSRKFRGGASPLLQAAGLQSADNRDMCGAIGSWWRPSVAPCGSVRRPATTTSSPFSASPFSVSPCLPLSASPCLPLSASHFSVPKSTFGASLAGAAASKYVLSAVKPRKPATTLPGNLRIAVL